MMSRGKRGIMDSYQRQLAEAKVEIDRLRTEREELREDAGQLRHRLAELREETCSPHWMGSAHQVVAYICELVGVGDV